MAANVRKLHPVSMAAFLAVLWCCVPSLSAQTTPSSQDDSIEFQRVYVPENRSQDWPRAGFDYAPQMELATFEQLVAQFRRSGSPIARDVPIRQVTYQARLDGQRLIGSADFALSNQLSNAQGHISLKQSNLFYFTDSTADVDGASVLLGGTSDRYGVFLREDRQHFRLSWLHQGAVNSSDGIEFDLDLALAPRVDFYLTLPIHWNVVVREGMLLRPPTLDEAETTAQQTWHLSPQWRGKLRILLVPRDRTFRAGTSLVNQSSTFQIRSNACVVTTNVSFHSPLEKPLELALPADMVVSEVTIDEVPQTDWDVRDTESGTRHLRIAPAALADKSSANVAVHGIAPLTVEDYSRVELPLMAVVSHPAESHVVTVNLAEDLHLAYCDLKSAQQVSYVPHNSLGDSHVQLRLFDNDAAVGLQLYRRSSALRTTAVHMATVNDLVIQSESRLLLSDTHPADHIELPLAQGWHVAEVLDHETDNPVRWEETTRDDRRILRVGNVQGLQLLAVSLRRPRENDFGNLRIADFRPFDFPLGMGNVEWVSLLAARGFELQLGPDGLVAQTELSDLPPVVGDLFDDEWTEPAFELHGRSDLRPQLRVMRTRATYQAAIDIQAIVQERGYQESASIRLDGSGLLPETLFVWSTRPWSEQVQWISPDLAPLAWTAVTPSADSEANDRDPYYIYELQIPSEYEFPLTLKAAFPAPAQAAYDRPLLLSVPTAEPQSGTLSLLTSDDCRIETAANLLRKVYLGGPRPTGGGKLVQLEYRPLEFRRLAEYQEELLSCSWTTGQPLPGVFATQGRHTVQVESNGQLRFRSRFDIVARHDVEVTFTLPPETTVEVVQWEDRLSARWQQQGDRLVVRLSETSPAGVLHLQYNQNSSRSGILQRVPRTFAQADFPVATEASEYLLGSRLQRLEGGANHRDLAKFGRHLRQQLWTGLFQVELFTDFGRDSAVAAGADLGEAAQGPRQSFDAPQLYVVHLDTLLVVGLTLFLLALLAGGWAILRYPQIVLAILLGCVVLAVWLPGALAPVISGVFLGLVLGGIGGTLLVAPVQSAPRSVASTITTSALVVMVCCGLAVETIPQAMAQEPDNTPITLVETPKPIVVYPVLIPIDEDRQPVGQAYLPQPLYQRLQGAAEDTQDQVPAFVVRGARYDISLSEALRTGPSISVTTLLELTTTRPNQTVRLPLDPQLGENLVTALLNGGILPSPYDATSDEIVLTLREAREHRVEVQSSIPLTIEQGAPPKLLLETFPHTGTAITLRDSLNLGPPQLVIGSSRVRLTGTSPSRSIPLGPVASLQLEWDAPRLQSTFEYQQLDLLEYHQNEVQLRARLRLADRAEEAGPVLLSTDPRLLLVPQQSTAAKIEPRTTSNSAATRTYAVTPLEGDDEVELRFRLTGAQKVGQLKVPRVQVLNGTLQRHWVAVSAGDDLQVQSQSRSRVDILAQERFVREWDGAVPDFRFAVAAVDEQPLDWIISTRPIAQRGVADLRHRLEVDEDGYEFEIKAQIETQSGQPQQYVVQMMPQCQVDSVQYLVDGLLRPTQWHYDPETGELGVLLLSATHGLQDLAIRGRQAHAAQQRLTLPPIEIRGVETNSLRVQIFRDHSVLVRAPLGMNAVPLQEEAVQPLVSDQVPVGQWQVLDPSETLEWQVVPNEVLFAGDLLTIANRENGAWRLDFVGRIEIRSGVVGYLEWLVPKGISLRAESIKGFDISSRLLPDESAYVYRMTPRGLLSSTLTFRWQADLETLPGQRVSFSPIRMIEQPPRIRQFAAVPTHIDTQEVFWEFRALRAEPVTGLWLTANTPPTHQLLYATRPDYLCRMVQRASRSGEIQIESAETTVLVDDAGGALGVTQVALDPVGNDRIAFTVPPGVQILGASVDFTRQAQLDQVEPGQVAVPLKSHTLPQVVEIAYQTQRQRTERPDRWTLPRPQVVAERVPEMVRVAHTQRGQATDALALPPERWKQNQVRAAFRLQDTSSDSLTGLGPAEIGRWNDVRVGQALVALSQFQEMLRGEGRSPEAIQSSISTLLGDRAREVESWSVTTVPEPSLSSVAWTSFTQEGAAPMYYERPPEAEDSLQFTERTGGPRLPGGAILTTLVCLVAGVLLFRPFAWVERAGLAARDWMVRNPQVCGIALGLFWWLFLPPNVFGLVLIAAVIWASLPSLPKALLGRV